MTRFVLLANGLLALSGIAFGQPAGASSARWVQSLERAIPLYGHRNWIVIADSAYPAQANPGIETVVADAGQEEVVRRVLGVLAKSRHVKPIVYTDLELRYVAEQDAPGIAAYRERLAQLVKGREMRAIPHEEIIARLDKAGQLFKILIVKTSMTLPYTSVFLELDCSYWNSDAEARLRSAIVVAPGH